MATKHDFLVVVPDRAGKLEARMAIRETHLKNVKVKADAGLFTFGGAMLDEPIQDGQPPKINGSVMVARAENEEQVLELLKQDVYWAEVWDQENIKITPIKRAL